MISAWLARYRATGADKAFGDPLPAHIGVAMEGYFWRFTQPDADDPRSLIALIGVNRGRHENWATLGLGSWPEPFLRVDAAPDAVADPARIGASARGFRGDDRKVHVNLGPDARLDVTISDPVLWPRRRWGGSSIFQLVPGLNQYWHPWLLGGSASGVATLGDRTWRLDRAQVYAEKNWGRDGFPDSWWWGQAQGFAEPGACVAFAGGQVHAGPLRTTVTAFVVRLPDGRLVRLGDPVVSPVRANVTDSTWTLRGRGFGWQVHVDGEAPLDAAHVLPVPLPAECRNIAGAIEHLGARLTVHVRRGGRTVWRGESTVAGLEHGGLARAASELRRRRAAPEAVCAAPVSRGGTAPTGRARR